MAAAVIYTLIKRDGTLQMDPYEHLYQIKRKLQLYDNSQRRWIKMYIYDIPWTYTFAPKPTNYRMEARLWLFAARRKRPRLDKTNDGKPATEAEVKDEKDTKMETNDNETETKPPEEKKEPAAVA